MTRSAIPIIKEYVKNLLREFKMHVNCVWSQLINDLPGQPKTVLRQSPRIISKV